MRGRDWIHLVGSVLGIAAFLISYATSSDVMVALGVVGICFEFALGGIGLSTLAVAFPIRGPWNPWLSIPHGQPRPRGTDVGLFVVGAFLIFIGFGAAVQDIGGHPNPQTFGYEQALALLFTFILAA